MLHRKDGIGQMMSGATWHSGQRVQSWFNQTKESSFSWSGSHLGDNSKRAVMCILMRSGFHLATLPQGPDWWRDSCPSGSFSLLHRGTLELWVTIRLLVTSLTKVLLALIAQFGRVASSRKCPGCSKNYGGHCVLRDLQCCRNSYTILYRRSTENSFMAWFLLWHVNCGTLYRQVCAFPNHVQSIEFTSWKIKL